jgi:hypothetical protein
MLIEHWSIDDGAAVKSINTWFFVSADLTSPRYLWCLTKFPQMMKSSWSLNLTQVKIQIVRMKQTVMWLILPWTGKTSTCFRPSFLVTSYTRISNGTTIYRAKSTVLTATYQLMAKCGRRWAMSVDVHVLRGGLCLVGWSLTHTTVSLRVTVEGFVTQLRPSRRD